MDENNQFDNMDQKPIKENPFKNKRFYIAYLTTVAVYFGISFITGGASAYWIITALILCIPSVIVGGIVYLILREKNRPVALGIFLGSVTPFVVVFLLTGGCGILR